MASAATLAAYLRLYNNAHWFGDVVAGAGISIVSAKAAKPGLSMDTQTYLRQVQVLISEYTAAPMAHWHNLFI